METASPPPPSPWVQVNITYPGDTPLKRERHAVDHLTQVLPAAEAEGHIISWWWIRKGAWRIRYQPTSPCSRDIVHTQLTRDHDCINDIYEPEVHGFGGHASMDLAHTLWHADSRHLLTYLADTPTNRRELSLILCTALMHAADLDPGEQGEVWATIADQRAPLRTDQPAPQAWAAFVDNVHQLVSGNPRPGTINPSWLTAFRHAGTQLAHLRSHGQLTRGIRAIAARHVIFHWNRIGISGPDQAALAQAAADAAT